LNELICGSRPCTPGRDSGNKADVRCIQCTDAVLTRRLPMNFKSWKQSTGEQGEWRSRIAFQSSPHFRGVRAPGRLGHPTANRPRLVNASYSWCDKLQIYPITDALHPCLGLCLARVFSFLQMPCLEALTPDLFPATVPSSRHQLALWSNGCVLCGSSQRQGMQYSYHE
jgi:hypothetical protein